MITQRRKQNLQDLNIDENGDILLDEDSDNEDLNSQDELLLQEEDDYASPDECELFIPRKTCAAKTLVEVPAKKRKNVQEVVETKRQKTNTLLCDVCHSRFYKKG